MRRRPTRVLDNLAVTLKRSGYPTAWDWDGLCSAEGYAYCQAHEKRRKHAASKQSLRSHERTPMPQLERINQIVRATGPVYKLTVEGIGRACDRLAVE